MTDPGISEVSIRPESVRAIFLVGFMGAGKTSVGLQLAKALSWRFVDLDERIIQAAGCSISQVFATRGEAEFRRLESLALREVMDELHEAPSIVALGGGAWVQEANSALIRISKQPAVFLDAPVSELWQRCLPEGEVRPLLHSEADFCRLYESRRPKYLEGTIAVNTAGEKVEAVAERILLLLGLAGSAVSK